ncbi:MAG: hypothetical protein ACSHYA_14490, partial [Opitutaceae bacterium]
FAAWCPSASSGSLTSSPAYVGLVCTVPVRFAPGLVGRPRNLSISSQVVLQALRWRVSSLRSSVPIAFLPTQPHGYAVDLW